MKFDTVIIGGGLAGMACGIRLAEAGKRCAIVSQGQSALHFSSGSFDLLGRLPDGTRVENPIEGIAALERTEPEHPYALIGAKPESPLRGVAAATISASPRWARRSPRGSPSTAT